MGIIRIDEPGDPRIAAYRDIRERDLVGRQGRFIAEGKVVLNVLLTERRFETESILVLENRLTGLSQILDNLPENVPVYVTSSAIMDQIAGFPMHRGILAIGIKKAPIGVGELLSTLGKDALVVVLVGISNHDNVGAIFRNAAAFGAKAVLLDTTSCDPLYRKAIRVSVGAALKVPFATFDAPLHVARELEQFGFRRFSLSPSGMTDIRDVVCDSPTALFLGSEGHGLPDDLMSCMDTLRIDMAKDFDSLNVATASAIALHHFARHAL